MEDDELTESAFAQAVLGRLEGDSDVQSEPEAEPEPQDTEAQQEAVTEDGRGNLHGPDGKFVPKSQDGEEAPASNPDLDAYLAKYGGDVDKALVGAVEAQKLIGRQGQELAEARRLSEQVEQLQQAMQHAQVQPVAPPVNWESLIEDNPEGAAQYAYQTGNYDAMVAAVDSWKDEDPFSAAVFWSNVQQQYNLQRVALALSEEQQQTPQNHPDLDREVAQVVTRNPGLEQMLPQIAEVAKETPLLRNALERGAPAERAQALEALYLLARGRDTDTLAREAAQRAHAEADRDAEQARASASVVSAHRGTAASGDQPSRADEFRQAFRQHLGLQLDDE